MVLALARGEELAQLVEELGCESVSILDTGISGLPVRAKRERDCVCEGWGQGHTSSWERCEPGMARGRLSGYG